MSSSCCGQIGYCIRNATSIVKIKVLKWVFFFFSFFFAHFSFRLSSHLFYLLNNLSQAVSLPHLHLIPLSVQER